MVDSTTYYKFLENSPISADWLKFVFLQLARETELAQAVDIMMARAKKSYVLIMKVDNLFSLFSTPWFLTEIENMYSLFLLSYGNTCESLRELEKLWKHSTAARVPTAFLDLPNFHSCFYQAIRLWPQDFYHVIVDEGAGRVNCHA